MIKYRINKRMETSLTYNGYNICTNILSTDYKLEQ